MYLRIVKNAVFLFFSFLFKAFSVTRLAFYSRWWCIYFVSRACTTNTCFNIICIFFLLTLSYYPKFFNKLAHSILCSLSLPLSFSLSLSPCTLKTHLFIFKMPSIIQATETHGGWWIRFYASLWNDVLMIVDSTSTIFSYARPSRRLRVPKKRSSIVLRWPTTSVNKWMKEISIEHHPRMDWENKYLEEIVFQKVP